LKERKHIKPIHANRTLPEETITDVVSAICRQHFQTVFNNRLPLVKHIWEL